MKFFVLILVFTTGISGCSDMNMAMDLQDDYAERFQASDTDQKLSIPNEFNPSIARGNIETKYSATVPKGLYAPIASSKGRVFYQAPKGFKYFKGRELESVVGGIVQVSANDKSSYYVWFFSKETEYFKIDPKGTWHSGVKPGLLNIKNRPWVEGDLKIKLKHNN
jgi:hypothetical protein